MVAVYGLTPDGFFPKSTDQIRSDSQTRLRNQFGQSLPIGDTDLLGQLVGIVAAAAGAAWSVGQQVYGSQDPDSATGAALDAISKLTGTFRPPATSSVANPQIITGTPGTVVAAGFTVGTASTSGATQFESAADVTLEAVSAWAINIEHAYGDLVTNAGNVYSCIVAGETASSGGGPTGDSESITDNTVTWAFCGAGTGAAAVEMDSIDTGPIVAEAYDLTVIQTDVGGVGGTINLLDAELGTTVASDEVLRLLREQELQSSGNSPVDAIRAALLNVNGVTTVTVYYNPTDTTDGNGLPPHSVMALVLGGADQDIWNTLWASVAGGIRTYGSTSGTVVDSQGNDQTQNFQRPASQSIYLYVFITYYAPSYGGDAAVQAAIANGANANGANYNAVPSALAAMAFGGNPAAGIAGVAGILYAKALVYTDVIGAASAWQASHAYVSTPGSRSVVTNDSGRYYICVSGGTSAGSGGPTGTGTAIVDGGVTWYFLENTINITAFQLASYETSQIVVNSTSGPE